MQCNTPSNPPLYPNIDINDDILSQSLYISSYYVTCNVMNCYTCDNSLVHIVYNLDILCWCIIVHAKVYI